MGTCAEQARRLESKSWLTWFDGVSNPQLQQLVVRPTKNIQGGRMWALGILFGLVMVGQEQRDACIQQHSGDLVGSRQVSDMRLRLFTILHTPISYVRVPFERGFDCGQQMRFRGHNLFKLFEATNSSGHVFSPIAKTLFTDWIGIGQKNHLPGEPHQKCSTLEPPPIRLEAIE